MDFQAIFTKTPRGVSEVKNRAARLPRNLLSVLALIDGKSSLERLVRESKLSEMKFAQAIERLEEEGFIKPCSVAPGGEGGAERINRPRRLRTVEGLDELDFSAITRSALEERTEGHLDDVPPGVGSLAAASIPETDPAQARAAAEAEARRVAEEALKAQAAAEAKARADEEARVRAENQARAEMELRARVAAEAEARSKAEARARLEAHMKAEAERKARAEAEQRAEEERQAREALEARLEAEKAARAEAEQRAREEAERKAREETEARLAKEMRNREEAERRAREELERKAREELEARLAEERHAREEGEHRARAEAEQKARAEMEARLAEERRVREELAAQLAAEQKAKEEAEQRAREAGERKAQEESERHAREEAERLAHQEAERVAHEAFESRLAAERRAREDAERRAAAEHEARQREDVARRAQEEADRKAREEAGRRAAEEAEQREAEHRAREEAERKMREELEANLAAERQAREEAERRNQEEAEARAQKEREAAERQALEDAELARVEREAREAAERRELDALEQGAREDAARAAADAEGAQKETADQEALAEAREALVEALPKALEQTDRQASEDEGRTEAEDNVPSAVTEPSRQDPATHADSPAVSLADTSTPFFEIDLDALDARERELRAEEEEKLRREAERHARELAAKDEAERAALAEAARLEHAAEETTRRAAEKAERAAQQEQRRREEEERRRQEDAERARREEEERRLAEEAMRRERVEAERRMREEAERRDREEAAARAQVEAQRKAEQKLQKKRAKEEEKARKRAAAEEKARARVATKAAASPPARGTRRKVNWKKPLAVSAPLVLAAAIGLVHVLPWDASGMEQVAMSALGEPVKIGSVRAGLFPSPHFKLEGVVIGKEHDARIAAVRVVPELSSLFSERKVLSGLELDSVTVDANVLRRLPSWVAPASAKPLQVAKVELRNVKFEGSAIALPPFGGEIGLDSGGAFAKAGLRSEDGKLKVDLRNMAEGVEAEFSGRGWQPPLGVGIEFDEIAGRAMLRGTQLVVTELTARLYGGTGTGHATLAWNSPWTLTGEFSANQLDLAAALKAFTNQFRASGRLAVSGRCTAQASSLDRLFTEPMVEAGFKVERGEIENLDLTRALQQAAAGTAVRGGKTQFSELSGTVRLSAKSYQYRQIALSSGILLASGNADMMPSGDLAGRLNVELAAKPNPIRALIAVSGKLSDPQLKPSR